MSAMTEQFAADVEAVEPDMPVYFVFKGKTYVGQRTEIIDTLDMRDAGYQQAYDFRLEVRTGQFTATAAPVVNDDIKIAAVFYRISKIHLSQDGVTTAWEMVQKT